MHRIKSVEKSNVFGDNAGPCHGLPRAFTFLNTVPLRKYIENTDSREFFKAYFECKRPMIVLTFGQKAAVAIFQADRHQIPLRIHHRNFHSW